MPEEKKLTRAERSALNRARHARERAKLEREWRARESEKQERREERREANREAFWRSRYGTPAPSQELRDELGEIPQAKSVIRETDDEWHVVGRDGRGYAVTRTWAVTMPDGERLEMPSAEGAAWVVGESVDMCRADGFTAGTESRGWRCTAADKTTVTLLDPWGREHRTKIRWTVDGRAWARPKGYATTLYADEMAA